MSIQRMLGSIEMTTFGQIQDITNDGEFTIAAPEGKIPTSITELVKVEIQKGGGSQSIKLTYSLDDLKDLQSKLALIRGNITDEKIASMAAAFWQVCILHAVGIIILNLTCCHFAVQS